MTTQTQMLDAAKQRLTDRVAAHSFLERCRRRAVTLDELEVMMVQQGLYGRYFTRYLCAMMAGLPHGEDVVKVAENLLEELGLADDSPVRHSELYRNMLGDFGLSLEGATPLLGTRRLIDTMFDHCRDSDPSRGLGALCLGAEMLVPTIYGSLLTGFEGCGVPAETTAFFSEHVECDDGHAEVMWDIMLGIARRDPERVPYMIAAGESMVDARLAFFSSIEESARAAAGSPRATPDPELIKA